MGVLLPYAIPGMIIVIVLFVSAFFPMAMEVAGTIAVLTWFFVSIIFELIKIMVQVIYLILKGE